MGQLPRGTVEWPLRLTAVGPIRPRNAPFQAASIRDAHRRAYRPTHLELGRRRNAARSTVAPNGCRLRVDRYTPFRQRCTAAYMFAVRPQRRFRQPDSKSVNPIQETDHWPHPFPGHRLGPMNGFLDRVQQRSIPMHFQNAPATFDGIVLAVMS